jgi:multidrug transporter EmrE-like cation transporter
VQQVKITKRLILHGILLGIPNFLSAYFILKVLQHFPGAIAFPLNNIGIIVLSVVVGRLIWQERFEKKTAAAIVIAAAAVVLLNMS